MLKTIKSVAKKIPYAASSYRFVRTAFSVAPSPPPAEEVFTNIFRHNTWRGIVSVSGVGSDLDQTRNIAKELPALFSDLEISSMLDIPCGDFNWMKTVDLNGVEYIGADIVKGLIQRNQNYRAEHIQFVCANLTTDRLPQVDLVFCRDCLVHLSFAEIFRALRNVCKSQSKYLLTTTFTARNENSDIATGDWRVLNLQIEPFNFPPPSRLIVEGCTEQEGKFEDKSLGLWCTKDIEECLRKSPGLRIPGS